MLQLLGRLLDWAPAIVGTLLSSAGAAVAGWVTVALSNYAPLSWVGAAFVGALIFALCYWAWTAAKVNLQRVEFARAQAEAVATINPLETTFQKQRISIDSFRTPFADPVDGKTFVDCELIGPGVVFFNGVSTLVNVRFDLCDFVRVRKGSRMFSGLVFSNTTVTRGRMRLMTILITEDMVDKLGFSPNWLTH